MKYDFTTLPDRRGTNAIALDDIGHEGAPGAPKEGFDAIPMWVADMNFATCPAIQEEIIRRVQHPAFGYFNISDQYYESIIRWQEKRNGVTGLEKKHIGYENGVLGGVISTLNVLCSRGDPVLIQTPHYIRQSLIFFFYGSLNTLNEHIVSRAVINNSRNKNCDCGFI